MIYINDRANTMREEGKVYASLILVRASGQPSDSSPTRQKMKAAISLQPQGQRSKCQLPQQSYHRTPKRTTSPSQNGVTNTNGPASSLPSSAYHHKGCYALGGDVDSCRRALDGSLVTHPRPILGPSTDSSLSIVSLSSSGACSQKAECQ